MSTITRERAAGIANGEKCYTHDDVVELARIALASLEAEQRNDRVCDEELNAALRLHGLKVDGHSQLSDAFRAAFKYARRTAPPAPVSVPDEITFEKIAEITASQGYEYSINECICAASWWNACRAAMLQGADGNSPVVPDGWVTCSERMPDENAEQEVLACFKGGDISTLYYFDGRWDDAYGIVPIRQDVTHWMPLPLPPTK